MLMNAGAPGAVYIVDDSTEVRALLSALFASVSIPTQQFHSGAEFLRVVDRSYSGCVLMDVRMPEMSGLEVAAHLRRRKLNLPVILMSGFADVPMAVKAMKLGAVDFVEKPFNSQDLIERVQQALAGYAEERAAFDEASESYQRLKSLSPREQEVLERILAGRKNKEIAYELNISLRTVETHRAAIMRKMECASVAELVQRVRTASRPMEAGG